MLMSEKNCDKSVLMVASVASMIDLFNEDNINILQSLGYIVHVMTNFENGSITSNERVQEFRRELDEKGVYATHVPIPRSLFKLKAIIESYRMIKKEVASKDYEIVHCHSPIGGVVCRMACRKARKKGTKVIYTAHGFHFFKGANFKNWLLFYPAEKLCSKYTDKLITINQEDYERASRWKTTSVDYVPGIGVSTEKFQLCSCDFEILRSSFGFQKDDFILMSTGQISVRKNQEVIIRALGKLNNHHIKYLLVGTGELEDKLKTLSKELKIEKQVVFAGYRRDISDLLHAVDAFVFPSLQEGLPVALMEAMASGLPIVCSCIRGNTDLIVDGKGGYLVAPRDVDGFAHAIKNMIENYEALQIMRETNIETMKNFDVAQVHKKMIEIYSSISQ